MRVFCRKVELRTIKPDFYKQSPFNGSVKLKSQVKGGKLLKTILHILHS